MKERSYFPSRSVLTRTVSPLGVMISMSSCGSERMVRSGFTTAARMRTWTIVSSGSDDLGIGTAPGATRCALSAEGLGLSGLHTSRSPFTRSELAPAFRSADSASDVIVKLMQLCFASVSTRVLETLRLIRPTRSSSE